MSDTRSYIYRVRYYLYFKSWYIYFVMGFLNYSDFSKHSIEILFTLLTEMFGTLLNFASEASLLLTSA